MIFEDTIQTLLNEKIDKLEKHFEADVLFYYGEIQTGIVRPFRDRIEEFKKDAAKIRKKLVIILNTGGGLAEVAEKFVAIVRQHYDEVYFVVPDFAMSAGTIFCMSGDKIYMDYSSSLGPIDPQVWNGKAYVPALGYLDKVESLLEKAANGNLSNAEFLILQSQDLAMLSRYEQARNLTVTLLKKWLVEYKFKNWDKHETDQAKLGQKVTTQEKEERAEGVAKTLGDNKLWHSHGRFIGIDRLTKDARLKIENYTDDFTLRPLIRSYNDLITEYIAKNNYTTFLHTKHFF